MTGMRGTVVVTGAAGLLGTWLRRSAPPGVDVVSVSHRRPVTGRTVAADLLDLAAVRGALAGVEPDLVIHAGYARDEASIVDATRHVARAADEVDAGLVFVSSEAVFAGDGTPRSEAAPVEPVWDYGRWKAAAERVVMGIDPLATVVRPPLIVSLEPEDHGLTDMRAARASGHPSTWFTDEVRQPAHADELARALWAIAALRGGARAGLWHLPGRERLSRFEIAMRAVDVLGFDPSSIVAASTPPSARRPRDLNLTGARASRQIGWSPRQIYRPATEAAGEVRRRG